MSGEELLTYGRIGALEHQPDGSGVQCHLCGRSFIHLGVHARHGHGMTAHQYREAFGLNRGTALTSSTHSDLLRRRALAQDAARRIQPYRYPGGSAPGRQARERDAAALRGVPRITVACVGCGTSMEAAFNRRSRPTYCPACRVQQQRIQGNKDNARYRAKHPRVPQPAREVACVRCRAAIIIPQSGTGSPMYCPACRADRHRERSRLTAARARARLAESRQS